MIGEHVVILGAGFSRAVSAGMPLTDELGNAALELVQPEGSRPKGLRFGSQLTFESWLSRTRSRRACARLASAWARSAFDLAS